MQIAEQEDDFRKPPRPWRRWLRRIGKIVLVMLLIAVCRMGYRHHEVTKKLEEALAEQDRADPGWRLQDIESSREMVPDDENGAAVVISAAKLIPNKWPPSELDERLNGFPPDEQLSPDDLAWLQKEMDLVQPALRVARKLAGMPRGRHRIEYKANVLDTLLQSQADARRVLALLVEDAILQAQKGDMSAAMLSCRSAFNAGRSIGDEPVVLSQLIRTACVVRACQALERTLAQGEPPIREMTEFAALIQLEDNFAEYATLARGERAAHHQTYDAVENGVVSMSELGGAKPSLFEQVFGFVIRDNIRNEHPLMLSLMNRVVEISQLPPEEQAEAEEQLDKEVRSLTSVAIMTRLLIPGLTKLGDSSRRKHACLRCMLVALAAERYRQDHKKWPDTIEGLCPKYLSLVPSDPYDGKPLRYRRLEDGVVIYSVGRDRKDNEGNLNREWPNNPAVDIGYRLWDAAKRRQPPKPKPPNPE